MKSPFKMLPKTPFMKALVGKQGNLPKHLRDAILAAPAKSYGKSPIKKDSDFAEDKVGIGETKTTKKDIGKGRTQTTKKRTVKKAVAPKNTDNMTSGEKKQARTTATRKGDGRLGTETTREISQKGVKGNKKTSTAYAGTAKDKYGRTKYRRLADGTTVVREGTVNAIKPRGIDGKKKGNKGKSPVKSYGKKTPIKKNCYKK